jgi:hypothetical protein
MFENAPLLYTQTAKKLIKPRHKFLQLFLKQVKLDLRQTYSITPN